MEDQKREVDGVISNHKPASVPQGGEDSYLSVYSAM